MKNMLTILGERSMSDGGLDLMLHVRSAYTIF